MKIQKYLKEKRGKALWSLLLLVLSGLFISLVIQNYFTRNESFADQAQLSNADCVKCHSAVQGTVESKGSKHKTAVGCLDCHKGHPPMVSKDKIIPVCSTCHAGKPHYEIAGCSTCHSNPHAPLDMKLAANLTEPCLSCHGKQGTELKDNPTKHSKFFCTTCHNAHREVPPCLKCHRPHSEDMVNKDCSVCHPAHQPRTIVFAQDMPNKNCSACHKTIIDTLTTTDSKHSKLACVFCHKEKHGNVPACESCHSSPHPPGMLEKFPKCNMCHISAHSLGKEAKK
jgi:hypothetical protein